MTSYNRNTLLVGVVAAVIVGGVISYFASAYPDGLEKTQEDLGAAEPVQHAVEVPAVAFQEYNFRWLPEGFWSNAVAGVTGSLLVLAILLGAGYLLRRGKPTQAPASAATPPHA
jgi:cobalt/nickel transport system permease protein